MYTFFLHSFTHAHTHTHTHTHTCVPPFSLPKTGSITNQIFTLTVHVQNFFKFHKHISVLYLPYVALILTHS